MEKIQLVHYYINNNCKLYIIYIVYFLINKYNIGKEGGLL